MKYTYSDDEDIYSYSTTARRSTRNTGTHTPAEPSGPTITQSGRQVKSRHGGAYGESMLSGQGVGVAVGGFDGASDEPSHDESAGARPRNQLWSSTSLDLVINSGVCPGNSLWSSA